MFNNLAQPSVISPIKCVKNEIHNVLTVLKFTKQLISIDRFKEELLREAESPLVQSFQKLFDSLGYVNEFYLDETHLLPFIEVIESSNTSGPVTAVALAAVNKFVVYGLIHSSKPGVETAINRLANGILNAKFQASGNESDEVVLLKILTVLVEILRCSAGEYLTDSVVWNMVKKAYQISRQPLASYLLRSSSENILQQMVLSIFGCHKPKDIKFNNNNLKPYGIPCMLKTLKFFAYLTSYGTQSIRTNESSFKIARKKKIKNIQQQTSQQSCDSTDDNTTSGEQSPTFSSSNKNDDLGLPFVKLNKETPELCEAMRTLGLSLLNVALETGGTEMSKHPSLVRVIQDEICKSLLRNARTDSLIILSITLRCIFNLFVYLKQHLKVQLEIFFNSIQLR